MILVRPGSVNKRFEVMIIIRRESIEMDPTFISKRSSIHIRAIHDSYQGDPCRDVRRQREDACMQTAFRKCADSVQEVRRQRSGSAQTTFRKETQRDRLRTCG